MSRKTRIPRPLKNRNVRAPMLVQRFVHSVKIITKEYMALEALCKGFATKHHYDTLLDMQGVMLMAGTTAPHRRYAHKIAEEVVGPTIISIKERYERTGALICSPEETTVLRYFLAVYDEFWKRQPTELYLDVCNKLQAHYQSGGQELTAEEQPQVITI